MPVGFRYVPGQAPGKGADLDLYSEAVSSSDCTLSAAIATILRPRGSWYGNLSLGLDIAAMSGASEDIAAILEAEVRRALLGLAEISALRITALPDRIWQISLVLTDAEGVSTATMELSL